MSIGIKSVYFILGILTSIILSRLLGVNNYGFYAFVLSFSMVLAVVSQMGTKTLILRRAPPLLDDDRNGEVFGLLIAVLTFTSVFVLGAASLFFIVFGALKSEHAASDIEFIQFFMLVAGQVWVVVLAGMLRAMRHVVLSQLAEYIILPAIFIIILLVLFQMKEDGSWHNAVNARSAALGFSALFQTVIFFWIGRKIWVEKPIIQDLPQNAKISMVFSTTEILRIVHIQFPILLLGIYAASSDVAFFRVAFLISTMVGFTLSAFGIVLSSRISSAYSRGDLELVEKLARKVSFAGLLISTFLFVGFAVAGKWLLSEFYSSEFLAAYPLALILATSQIIHAWTGQVGLILNLTGHEKSMIKAVSIGLAFQIILFAVLYPLYGVIGAALAFAISEGCVQSIIVASVRCNLRIHPLWLPKKY